MKHLHVVILSIATTYYFAYGMACAQTNISGYRYPADNESSTASTDFPDYSQPTTRYVTSGTNLRNTRQFGLGEQMSRESLGFISR